MKTNTKKIIKLLTLFISSILIATASAGYYRFMYISGTVTISAGGLVWIKGDQAGSAVSISGSTATVSLTLNNGTISNITNYLYLKNLDSQSHNIVINITDPAGSSLYEANGFNITICNNSTGAVIHSLDALSLGSSYSGTIDQQEVWHIIFQIATRSDAQTSGDAFAVQVTYV
jgi:hypothetical protein